MGDFKVWWALFVFFGGLSVLSVWQGYRRWRRAGDRREGQRFGAMVVSLVSMTALVFGALLRAPAELLLGLRVLAVVAVAVVIWLSVSR